MSFEVCFWIIQLSFAASIREKLTPRRSTGSSYPKANSPAASLFLNKRSEQEREFHAQGVGTYHSHLASVGTRIPRVQRCHQRLSSREHARITSPCYRNARSPSGKPPFYIQKNKHLPPTEALTVDDHQGVYDQIEARVNEMMATGKLDDRRTLAYKSFLFLIM